MHDNLKQDINVIMYLHDNLFAVRNCESWWTKASPCDRRGNS